MRAELAVITCRPGGMLRAQLYRRTPNGAAPCGWMQSHDWEDVATVVRLTLNTPARSRGEESRNDDHEGNRKKVGPTTRARPT